MVGSTWSRWARQENNIVIPDNVAVIAIEMSNSDALLTSILLLTCRLKDMSGTLTATSMANHNIFMRQLDCVKRAVNCVAIQQVVTVACMHAGGGDRGNMGEEVGLQQILLGRN